MFQHTAARRRLVREWYDHSFRFIVSTHSRPKAAGALGQRANQFGFGFNTQPPEGGWLKIMHFLLKLRVSTHSRPKAAGSAIRLTKSRFAVSTHSRPKAAGGFRYGAPNGKHVSTHSRPKAAGCDPIQPLKDGIVSTHSRPKAAGFANQHSKHG